MLSRRLIALLLLFFIVTASILSVYGRVNAAEDENLEEDVEVGEESEGEPTKKHASTERTAGDNAGEDFDEDVDEGEEEGTHVLQSSPDVQTTVIFPDFPDKRLVQGEDVVVLIGFRNNGQKTFNVSYMGASLRSPYDYSYIIQNLTFAELGALVEPGQEVSIEYKFKADPGLEPLEFWLSGFLLYNSSETQLYRTAFYNSTVDYVEKPTSFDVKHFFSYFLIVGLLGLIGYIVYQIGGGEKKVKRLGLGRKSAAAIAEAGSSWETSVYTPAAKSKAVGSSKRKSAAKKSS